MANKHIDDHNNDHIDIDEDESEPVKFEVVIPEGTKPDPNGIDDWLEQLIRAKIEARLRKLQEEEEKP